ncbi:deoxyribonuclease Tat-D [Protomyces lactucae-debilis]|uniref:Deoxyribonuclease Tat-D n=1 Tax=Protomyces lactucae-debilis TaxID=2754530 RepID=A0A1Y2FGU3_PROLT|nr:deoxyribonuclease Tat-D [Protomyces lactucae-debilis]ORY83143.1 deoxyribonuclease Tat-D [Protomyces lactucae-debilis]
MPAQNKSLHEFFDIAVNATDLIFRGSYRGKQEHADDMTHVLQRSRDAGCSQWLVTGTDLEDSQKAHALCLEHPDMLVCTAGIHPTQSKLWLEYRDGPDACLDALMALIQQDQTSSNPRIRAFGELGLDYDRLDWSPKDTQLACFRAQMELAVAFQLPLFLHSRAAANDFASILDVYQARLPKRGVVHSFTGTLEEMQSLCAQGWSIGINGCSLKTQENLHVAKHVPLDKLMLETDAPWCEIRPSHASMALLQKPDCTGEAAPVLEDARKVERFEMGLRVRGRNEPCSVSQVAFAVANIKGISMAEVSQAAYRNSMSMFGMA